MKRTTSGCGRPSSRPGLGRNKPKFGGQAAQLLNWPGLFTNDRYESVFGRGKTPPSDAAGRAIIGVRELLPPRRDQRSALRGLGWDRLSSTRRQFDPDSIKLAQSARQSVPAKAGGKSSRQRCSASNLWIFISVQIRFTNNAG